ncbi:MAG: hypothetical protein IPL61_27385 [Myxococcales bacterium]|nr:hypothetical protein [Myxococcales bacterium]
MLGPATLTDRRWVPEGPLHAADGERHADVRNLTINNASTGLTMRSGATTLVRLAVTNATGAAVRVESGAPVLDAFTIRNSARLRRRRRAAIANAVVHSIPTTGSSSRPAPGAISADVVNSTIHGAPTAAGRRRRRCVGGRFDREQHHLEQRHRAEPDIRRRDLARLRELGHLGQLDGLRSRGDRRGPTVGSISGHFDIIECFIRNLRLVDNDPRPHGWLTAPEVPHAAAASSPRSIPSPQPRSVREGPHGVPGKTAHLGVALVALAVFTGGMMRFFPETSLAMSRWAFAGTWNWLLVLALFMGVGYVGDRLAWSRSSRALQYLGLGSA